MKRLFHVLNGLLAFFIFVSCAYQEQGFIIDPEPYDNYHTDSSDVTAEIDGEVTTASETITIRITGSNVPNEPYALYYFCVPALEYKDGDNWKRIPVKEDSKTEWMQTDPGEFWNYVFREGDDLPEVMWTEAVIQTERLTRPLKKGDYRTVLFMPDRTIYTEFTISE